MPGILFFCSLIISININVLDIYIVLFLQERVLQKLNSHHNQQALTSSIEEGLKLQAQNRLQRMLRQVRIYPKIFPSVCDITL